MTSRKPRRDSDVVPSNVGRKELLFKFLVIGDYGVGKFCTKCLNIAWKVQQKYSCALFSGKTAIVRRYTEGNFGVRNLFNQLRECTIFVIYLTWHGDKLLLSSL